MRAHNHISSFFFTVDRVEGVETCTMGRCAKEQQMVRKELKVCLLVLAVWFVAGANKEPGLLSENGTAFAVPMESPAGKRRMLPPIGKVANEATDVFISLQGYEKKIDTLFEPNHDVVFIRGGVAIGKTTLAEHLAAKFPKKYVNVPFTSRGTEEAWRANTIKAVEKATGKKIARDGLAFGNALELAKDKKMTLIYDEVHTLFSTNLCTDLFKSNQDYRPKILLFSASASAATAGQRSVATPSEITQKFMWAPPLLYSEELRTQLKECGIRLDRESIEFLIRFCGDHRGIFISAMHWLKQAQEEDGGEWSIHQTVSRVRQSFQKGWDAGQENILPTLCESRAVRVNGEFASLDNIPKQFAEILCEGPRRVDAMLRKTLTICGFILPYYEPSQDEFHRVDWTDERQLYKVANPMMVSYYRHHLQKYKGLEVVIGQSFLNPENCADLIMRAVPYLSFSKVVSLGGQMLGADGLPHEDDYNAAIVGALQSLEYVAYPTKCPTGGRPDCTVRVGGQTFVLEGVKLGNKIENHRERFEKNRNYRDANHKGLFIIGNDIDKVNQTVKNTNAEGVQIIGLIPNSAHTTYTVLVQGMGDFVVECDLVARGLKVQADGTRQLVCVQTLKNFEAKPSSQSAHLFLFFSSLRQEP